MDLYNKYELTRIVNGCGKMTHLSGAAVLPPITDQVLAALPCFFDLDQLGGMPSVRVIGNSLLSFLSKVSSGYWDLFDPTNGFTALELSLIHI